MSRVKQREESENFRKMEVNRKTFATKQLVHRGYSIKTPDHNTIEFKYKGSMIRFYFLSGWFTGKTIEDGRGIKNLLIQLDGGWKADLFKMRNRLGL